MIPFVWAQDGLFTHYLLEEHVPCFNVMEMW